MKNSEELDQLLKQALSPTVEPSEALNLDIINKLKEKDVMKPVYKRKMSIALIAAILTVAMSITVFATWKLLSPKQVADHLGNKALAEAFDSKGATEINKSVASGEYNLTLHGIVSGKDLSGFKSSAQDIRLDRTYAVVSIAKLDGSRMPDTKDEAYGKVPFFISPLIKGQKPWQYNIASMNGGYSECVIDGIMYRLIECDGIEMFADRGLYLCIITSNFYDTKAFHFNEKTGEIVPNTDYKGVNVLFDLPFDLAKADHEKAEKYLQNLMKPSNDSAANQKASIDPEKEFAKGVIIPESVKEVTYDAEGLAHYEYNGCKISENVVMRFKGAPKVVSKIICIQSDGKIRTAVRFSRDAKGVITGMMLKLK